MGIGHMRRNTLIAHAIAASGLRASVLLITGAREACTFLLPSGADCLSLPSYGKEASGEYQSRSLSISLEELVALRSHMILAALETFKPDVLIVDKVPRGALRELEAALEHLRSRGTARCVLGLRDVLDDPATVQREWILQDHEEAIRRYYSAIWIYGDPAVYDQVAEYGFPVHVAAKARFTGYLTRPRPPSSPDFRSLDLLSPGAPSPSRLWLCMVGGGQDGADLAKSFAQVAFPPNTIGIVLTGPYMPAESQSYLNELARDKPQLRVLSFVRDSAPLACLADRVVAMGGYNTVCELLALEKQALIVPRVNPRMEQFIRAERLQKLGLLDVLPPDEMNPASLTNWLRCDCAVRPTRPQLDLAGAAKLPQLLNELIDDLARTGIPERAARRMHHAVH
jgi:predicted glycosyltransferase